MKQLACADAGFECDQVIEGESTDEVMSQAGAHAKEAHGVDVTPEMASALSGKIRDA